MNLNFFIIINLLIQLSSSSSHLIVFQDEPKLSNISEIYPQHKSRRLMCVSDRPRDAIVWNTKLVWYDDYFKNDERNELKDSELSINNKQGCGLSVDEKCLSLWSQISGNWSIVNSLDFPMGPVYDSRWENFTDLRSEEFVPITTKNKVNSTLRLGETGSIAFSIRGLNGIEILICDRTNLEYADCYRIEIDNAKSMIKYCQYGTSSISANTCRFLDNYRNAPLSVSEWNTFVLKWKNWGIDIDVFYRDGKILHANSFFDIHPHIFYRNRNNSMFRIHDYFYTRTIDRGAILRSAPLILENSQELCIDMIVGLCEHCGLVVNIMDGLGKKRMIKRFRRSKYDNIEHDLPMWQNKKIQENNISDYPTPISLELIASVTSEKIDTTNDYWVITKFEQCLPKGTVKSVKMTAYQDCNSNGCFWNPITCQRLSYDDPKSITVEAMDVFSPNLHNFENCQNNNIGPNCAIKCDRFFQPNCYGVQMYTENGCSCAQGWQGSNCTTKCSPGSYGFGCSKKCNNCTDNSCDNYTGKCHLGCKSTLPKFHVSPYCNMVVEPPLVPFVDELKDTNARVYLYEEEVYKIINATFEFEIKTKSGGIFIKDAQNTVFTSNDTHKNIYYTIFDGLSPGTEYSVKAILRIQFGSNKTREIIGNSATFVTLCNRNQRFDIKPHERSLLIMKIPEETYRCPDSWYIIDLSIISLITNKTYSVDISNNETKFPITLLELHPFAKYQVCIKCKDNKSQICQISSTLEAAPSPVANLQVKSITATEAEINWSSPESPNGILKGYNLTIEVLYYIGCGNKENTPENLKMTKVYPNIAPTTEASYNLTNLVPYVSYQLTVIAFNSKIGNKSSLIFSTKPRDIPTTIFTNIRFLHNNSITWDNPADCHTITGPIQGSRIFITGVSENVKNVSYSYDTNAYFLNLKTLLIAGNEIYRAKLYVLHELDKSVNTTAYTEIFFSTDPSSPPKVQNLQIVEVDKLTTTLKWQQPLPPLNGELDYYSIRFLLRNGTFLHEMKVYPNETCYLWKNSFCKTVPHPSLTIKQSIEVKAYNKGVSDPGESLIIDDNREEQISEKPEIISITEINKGVVHLKWQHPFITGGPMKNFIILLQTLDTELEHITDQHIHQTIIFPIHKYEPEYSTYLYLLPSTRYKIFIQGETSIRKGILSSKTIKTNSALDFQYEPHPVLANDTFSINIIIPPVINNTKDSQLHIIVKGPSICKQRRILSEQIIKDIQVDNPDTAWCVATFPTHKTVNLSFTIGNNHIYDTVSNCSLNVGNSYVIVLLVREEINLNMNKTSPLLFWQSKPILVGGVLKIHHEKWAIPFTLALVIICGISFYWLRKRRHQEYYDENPNDETTESIPIHEYITTEEKDRKSENLNQKNNTSDIVDNKKSISKSQSSSRTYMNESIANDPIYEDIPNTVDAPESFLKTSLNSTEHTDLTVSTESRYENLKSNTAIDNQSYQEHPTKNKEHLHQESLNFYC